MVNGDEVVRVIAETKVVGETEVVGRREVVAVVGGEEAKVEAH